MPCRAIFARRESLILHRHVFASTPLTGCSWPTGPRFELKLRYRLPVPFAPVAVEGVHRLIGALIGCVSVLLVTQPSTAGPTLYTFLHTDIKGPALEAMLEDTLSGAEVVTFGRIRDLESKLKSKPPVAIMARTAVLDMLNLSRTVQGQNNGEPAESLVFLTTGVTDRSTLLAKPVGVLDILGRSRIQEYYSKLLQVDQKIRFKRVTKLEDLLSLLQFKVVDGVLISESQADLLLSKTKMKLVVAPVEGVEVGFPAVGFVGGQPDGALIKSIVNMSPETREVIGVDQWVVSQ